MLKGAFCTRLVGVIGLYKFRAITTAIAPTASSIVSLYYTYTKQPVGLTSINTEELLKRPTSDMNASDVQTPQATFDILEFK